MEVLLEITKCCDLYLMERVVDDESEVRATTSFPLILPSHSCSFIGSSMSHQISCDSHH